jgi:hypothetical protein
MNYLRIRAVPVFFILFFIATPPTVYGWYDETHLVIAKAAGYSKWYNAVGADIAKIKAGSKESYRRLTKGIGERKNSRKIYKP